MRLRDKPEGVIHFTAVAISEFGSVNLSLLALAKPIILRHKPASVRVHDVHLSADATLLRNVALPIFGEVIETLHLEARVRASE
jgi:hypothetical protein